MGEQDPNPIEEFEDLHKVYTQYSEDIAKASDLTKDFFEEARAKAYERMGELASDDAVVEYYRGLAGPIFQARAELDKLAETALPLKLISEESLAERRARVEQKAETEELRIAVFFMGHFAVEAVEKVSPLEDEGSEPAPEPPQNEGSESEPKKEKLGPTIRYEVKGYELHRRSGRVDLRKGRSDIRFGKERLARTRLDYLRFMAEHPGQIFTRSQVWQQLYPSVEYNEPLGQLTTNFLQEELRHRDNPVVTRIEEGRRYPRFGITKFDVVIEGDLPDEAIDLEVRGRGPLTQNYKGRVRELLEGSRPGLTSSELAEHLYGETSQRNRNRASSLISAVRRDLTETGDGQVVSEKSEDEEESRYRIERTQEPDDDEGSAGVAATGPEPSQPGGGETPIDTDETPTPMGVDREAVEAESESQRQALSNFEAILLVDFLHRQSLPLQKLGIREFEEETLQKAEELLEELPVATPANKELLEQVRSSAVNKLLFALSSNEEFDRACAQIEQGSLQEQLLCYVMDNEKSNQLVEFIQKETDTTRVVDKWGNLLYFDKRTDLGDGHITIDVITDHVHPTRLAQKIDVTIDQLDSPGQPEPAERDFELALLEATAAGSSRDEESQPSKEELLAADLRQLEADNRKVDERREVWEDKLRGDVRYLTRDILGALGTVKPDRRYTARTLQSTISWMTRRTIRNAAERSIFSGKSNSNGISLEEVVLIGIDRNAPDLSADANTWSKVRRMVRGAIDEYINEGADPDIDS